MPEKTGKRPQNAGKGPAGPFVVQVTMERVDPETEEPVVDTLMVKVDGLAPGEAFIGEFTCFSGTIMGVVDPTEAIVESSGETTPGRSPTAASTETGYGGRAGR